MEINFNCLIQAVSQENIPRILGILDLYPQLLNHKNERQQLTPLFQSTLLSSTPITQLLLEKGADPNIPNAAGQTPLHQAVDQSSSSLVIQLLKKGADTNLKSKQGQTPLHLASYRGDIQILKLLLKQKTDPNQMTAFGNSALHIALEGRQERCARLLIEYGASLTQLNAHNKNAFELAQEIGIDFSMYKPQVLVQENQELTEQTTKLTVKGNQISMTVEEPDAQISMKSQFSQLFDFLSEIDLLKYFNLLTENGFSSLDSLVEQQARSCPLSVQGLKKIGFQKVGECMRFLIGLDEKTRILPSYNVVFPMGKPQLGFCCTRRRPSSSFVFDLFQWLALINKEHLYQKFMEADYCELEFLYKQVYSRYPIDEQFLESIGIWNQEDRLAVIEKLEEECKVYIGRNLVVESKSEYFSCNCLIF